MLDYQRIVDDVRGVLFNNGQDGDDFLQGAAADYSLAVDEANERLRQTNDELQTIYNGMIEGLLVTDIETKRFVRNQRMIWFLAW